MADDLKGAALLRAVGEGGELSPVVKALVISVDGKQVASASNNQPSVEAEQGIFLSAGALTPRYEPWALARIFESSSALRPCIDSYAANVDSYGFTLDPVIDLDKANARDLVRSALLQQRIYDGSVDPITDDHVDATVELVRLDMQRERFTLDRFFAYCCPTTSFVELRQQTRVELESMGNAYWEVVRNGVGKIQQFERIDAVTMRLRPIQLSHILVDTPHKVSPIHYENEPVPRRFRTFVQLVNGLIAVYFKEFGDPRTLSAKTGNYYRDVEELQAVEGEYAVAANEVLWWSIFAPIGPYGVPRWVGATMNVMGLRASEEINFSYFDKKCIPPMAILVSGGSLKEGAVDAIKAHLRETIQGRENFHSILIIEAESTPSTATGSASRIKVELRPLTEAQLKDALFQEYEKNSTSKIGAQFRLPELLRGVSQEVNRAQAEAVLQFAEQQVFEPIRQAFDHVMNRRVFADMGVRYWTFKTSSAPASDAGQLIGFISQLATAGALSVNDARELAGEALNKEYPRVDEPWADQPYTLTLQGVIDFATGTTKATPPPPGGPGGAPPFGKPGAPGAPPFGKPVAGGAPGQPGGAAAPPGTPAPPGGNGGVPGGTPPAAPAADEPDLPDPKDWLKGAPVAKRVVVPLNVLLGWVEPDKE